MHKIIFSLVILGLTLTSCERYETIDFDIPFKSKVVVASFLTADETQIAVWLTRTTKAVGAETPQEPTLVTDAEVTLIHEGNSYLLVYDSMEKVYVGDMNGAPFESGKKYTLLVKSGDETVTGYTTIPLPAITESTCKIDSIFGINGLTYLVTFTTKQLSAGNNHLFLYPYIVFEDSSRYALFYDGRDRARASRQGQTISQTFSASYSQSRPVRVELLTYTCDEPYASYYNKSATFNYGSLGMAFGEVTITYSNMSNKIGVFASYVASNGESFPLQ
jgi:hypothetical protein